MIYNDFYFSRLDFAPLHGHLRMLLFIDYVIMNQRKTVFSQIMSLIPRYTFEKCVDKYKGNRHSIRLTCRDQFYAMSFAQFTDLDSLRSIEATFSALSSKLYLSGLKPMPKSSLAEMNSKKDWRIYRDFGQVLIKRVQDLYKDDDFCLGIENAVYAFDSSTISLCLCLCPWAKFRKNKGGIKMHTLLDLRGSIPTLVYLTPASVHDSKAMDKIPVEAGARYLMDRGYCNYKKLYELFQLQNAYFVTRGKFNM